MNQVRLNDDAVWERVLESLSRDKVLNRFYKKPRHEMLAIMRLWSRQTPKDLAQLFIWTQLGQVEERDAFILRLDESRVFAILLVLGRSMKCWVETDSPTQNTKKRWKVASA